MHNFISIQLNLNFSLNLQNNFRKLIIQKSLNVLRSQIYPQMDSLKLGTIIFPIIFTTSEDK